jgi:hypothetical protein
MKGPLIYIVSDRFDVFDFRFRSITPLLLVSGEIVEYTTRIACPIGFFTIYHLCFLQVARIDGYASLVSVQAFLAHGSGALQFPFSQQARRL